MKIPKFISGLYQYFKHKGVVYNNILVVDTLRDSRIKSLEVASKRCAKNGDYFELDKMPKFIRKMYNKHPLAAALSNYSAIISVSMEEKEYLDVLQYELIVANTINAFCDKNMISNHRVTKYWLGYANENIFLNVVDYSHLLKQKSYCPATA